jgi:hypothetical protein
MFLKEVTAPKSDKVDARNEETIIFRPPRWYL